MASLAFSLAFYGKIHIENLRQKYLGKGCLLLNMVNQGKYQGESGASQRETASEVRLTLGRALWRGRAKKNCYGQ